MTFDQAFIIVLTLEGGYVNDPLDPGGETKYGICKKFYPDLDIKNLTVDAAKEIYKRDFWDKCNCDKMPSDLALCVFDCAVNQGVWAASRLLQEAVKSKIDGIIGEQTLGKINSETLADFMTLRNIRYIATKNFDKFGRGWIKRLFNLMRKLK